MLLTSTASATPGTYPLLITGSGTVDGGIVQRTAQVQLTILPAGTSTLSGRVLAAKDSVPIAGVTVKLNALTAVTDAGGNFLMQNVPAGSQIVFVDGASASSASVLYPIVPIPVTIVSGQNNTLPWQVFLHEMSRNYTPITPGQDTIVTDQKIPNFVMRIPAGAQIIGWDGQPNTQISVSAVAADRNALAPLPNFGPGSVFSDLYLFNFGKPGGGNPTQPIPVIFPNDLGGVPGDRVELYYYDESLTPDPNSNTWKKYGDGTVSPDGRSIIPDPGVGIPKFCCGGGGARLPPPFNPPCDALNCGKGGDPVILSTGQFAIEQTDLVLPGRIPVAIRRGYRSPEPGGNFSPAPNLGSFGQRSLLLEYEDRLAPAQMFRGGARPRPEEVGNLAYATNFGVALLPRQLDGTYSSSSNAVRGSVARMNSDGSTQIRFKDGMIKRFDTNGRLIEIADRNDNRVTIVRDPSGRITEIREPAGRALTVTYDASGRIAEIQDPIGRRVQYQYTASGPSGLLSSVTNPAGGVTSYTYNTSGQLLSVTDARQITYLTNEYNAAGRVFRQTQADGGVWNYAYTEAGGRLTQTVLADPLTHSSIHRFNSRGYEVEMVDALGQATRNTLDFTTNQRLEIRDPLNRLTKYTYDPFGNVNSILDPQQNPTLFEYETNFNRVTKITDALNQNTRFTYDPATGNLLTTTDPLNHARAISYNQFGQPISVTDALNQTTAFEYDDVGNLIATTDPLGNRTLRFYDAVSRLIALVDPRGKSTQFTYDALNRVTQIQDALNGTTSFTYDPNGNLLTVTDAKTQTTSYTYDNMDRLATRTDALNRIESYQYDLAGNLTQFTDRKNQVTTFQYDALNRRTSATYADATTTFVYDTVGRLVKANDTAPGAGTIDFAYDILDRLIQETTPQGTVAYQYDVLGRRTHMTANGQQPTTYQYDAASRLIQVAQGSLVVGLGYDYANRRTSLSYPNGTSTSYTYDVASRLTNIFHQGPSGVIENLAYVYDAAGNRTSLTRTNAVASLLPAAVASATYDAANEQTAFGGAMLTYDANGNLTNDGVNTYQWDARNRLTGVTGGSTATFAYDLLGRRVIKTINGVASQFLYDRNDIAAEIGGGAVGANYLRSLDIDEPFIRQAGTGDEHYRTDALGSSLMLSNEQGGSATAYTYEPFGKTTMSGASSNVLQYTGRENDGTGLHYYRLRYYSPLRARFILEDPLQLLSGDTNFYGYISQDPLNRRDPYGLIGYPGAALLGCTSGLIGGVGGRKPIIGGIVGGLVGCSYSPLIVGLQLLPAAKGLSIGLGAYIGAVSGAATAAAQGGNLTDIAIGAAGGAVGGAISGAISNPFLSTASGQLGAAILSSVANSLAR